MFDILLYDLGDDQILIECDRELSPKVFKHMSMYKIRKKVELIKDPDFQIGHLLGSVTQTIQKCPDFNRYLVIWQRMMSMIIN